MVKTKRNIKNNRTDFYRELLLQIERKHPTTYIRVKDSIAPSRIISKSFAVISTPISTTAVIARNLGIPKSTLYCWTREFKEHGESSFPGSGHLKPSNEEIYRLKKQLAEMTMERDILKKAAAIFLKAK